MTEYLRCRCSLATPPPGGRPGFALQFVRSAIVVAAMIAGALDSRCALAADRNSDFVAELRKRGWDDTAVEYMDWVEKSPLASDEFRKELPYQRAVSLAEQARGSRNRDDRTRLQSQAADSFEQFAQANPDSAVALDALRQSASLHAEQAVAAISSAEQLPESASRERGEARAKAIESFGRASKTAARIVEISTAELAKLPKPAVIQADPEAKKRRDMLRGKQAEARFLVALLAFEQARAEEDKSAKKSEALKRASEGFVKLHEEYGDTLVGASSRFYQGRCAQELGDFRKALACYQDLISLPTAEPEFRRWSARAHRHRTECLARLDKLDEAILAAQEWLATSSPAERGQPEWLELSYRLAEAYQAQARELKPGDSDRKKLETEARSLLREVAARPNSFQQQARAGAASAAATPRARADAKDFADAFAAGKNALEVMNSSMLAAKLARQNNPEAVEELEQQAQENKAEALAMIERAIALADRQTPIEDLNAARYYLCWLYWEDGRTQDAAVLGEFLARRYPEGEFAAGAAKVALAAFEKLAAESAAKDGASPAGSGPAFAATKLAELAEIVTTRWPDSPEASAAMNILIHRALREDRLADAETLLTRLPAGARGAAELSLGAALWTQYLQMTAGETTPPQEAIALRDKAGGLLKSGFDGAKERGNATVSIATGALYLAQYLLSQGDAKGAVEVLEDGAIGPLALVEAKAEAADRAEFVQETYKAALRAYLSTDPPQRENAGETMDALEAAVSAGGGDSAEQLTRVYLSLGLQLQRQVKDLTAAGQEDKAKNVAAAFGDVLDKLGDQPNAGDWTTRSRIAQINLQIGEGLAGAEAKVYLQRAKSAYESIVAEAAKDKSFVPDANALLAVRMRLADCLKSLGDYSGALDQYAAILRERPNMLDLQLAAAMSLQQWGAAKKDLSAIDRAIRGALPQAKNSNKNLVWGWLRLAAMADQARRQTSQGDASNTDAQARAARFEDLFFEARYNVVKARYMASKFTTGDQRNLQLRSAKQNIDQMRGLYPDLGGPKWKAAFAELEKLINEELAKK